MGILVSSRMDVKEEKDVQEEKEGVKEGKEGVGQVFPVVFSGGPCGGKTLAQVAPCLHYQYLAAVYTSVDTRH